VCFSALMRFNTLCPFMVMFDFILCV
jgi:hypothetical protein